MENGPQMTNAVKPLGKRDIILKELLLLVREIDDSFGGKQLNHNLNVSHHHQPANHYQQAAGDQRGVDNAQQAGYGYQQQTVSSHQQQAGYAHQQQPVNGHQQQPVSGYQQQPMSGHQQQPMDSHQQQPMSGNQQQPVNGVDAVCVCEGDYDLRRDEYFQPQTLDGEPARPVLTRRAVDNSADFQARRICPPCYKILPKMDITLSCYQPPWKKHDEPSPMDKNIAHGGNHNATTSRETYNTENHNRQEYGHNREFGTQGEQQNTIRNETDQLKWDQQHQQQLPQSTGNSYNQLTQPYDQHTHSKDQHTHPMDQHAHPCDQQIHPYDQQQHQTGHRVGHHQENMQQSQQTYKCVYDPMKESLRRVTCDQSNTMQAPGQSQSYSGTPEKYQEPLRDGGDGNINRMNHQGTESQHYEHKPQGPIGNALLNHHKYPAEGLQKIYPNGEPKQQSLPEPGKLHEPKSLHDHLPKAVVILKHKEDRHPDQHHRYDETKYYPVLIPKDVVWPKPKNHHHQGHEQSKIEGFDELKYQPILIPKQAIYQFSVNTPFEDPKHLVQQCLITPGKAHHGTPEQYIPNQPTYGGQYHANNELPRTERRNGIGPMTNAMGSQANIMGPQANVMGPQANIMGPQANVMGPQANIMGPQANVMGPHANGLKPYTNGMVQQRNGLSPQTNGSGQPKERQGQSVSCFEDRIRKEQQAALNNSDPYGGQKCASVHPPPSYFTYSCPDNKYHSHWSAPETTICRYPNPCMASCFEHPVFNDWVYQQPTYRYFMQRRDYKPF